MRRSYSTDTQPRMSLFDRFLSFLTSRKPSDKFFLYLFLAAFVITSLFVLTHINDQHTVLVPQHGGTLVEGVIGTPRFINPVLAITRADHDLVALTYSGLMKLGEDGTLANDLADSITVSDDGLVYNVVLKSDRTFHDGTPLTADDIAFTIGLIQNPELKSPLRGNWAGVSVEVLGEHELNLVLDNAYAPFLENLTVGILPKHIWSELSIEELPFSQYNTEPVGSGPYQVTKIVRNEAGLIDEYHLKAANLPQTPHIETVVIRFYQNESDVIEALKNKTITSTAAISEDPSQLTGIEGINTFIEPLPRVFAVYFNQNRSPALRDNSAREALSVLLDRDALVQTVLGDYGFPTNTPIPAGFLVANTSSATTTEARLAAAKDLLFAGDWTLTEAGVWEKEIDSEPTELALTLKTANSPLFVQTANYLKTVWETLGVSVTIEVYEQSDLVQTAIRPRDYQALLFGADVGRSLDLYPFWHSSEREDPGLNIALYTNITADKLLTDARKTSDLEERDKLLSQFVDELNTETPAIFLFSPAFVYVTTPTLSLDLVGHIARPSERFANIETWYMDQSEVWPIFTDNN